MDLGKFISEGRTRKVYEHPKNPSLVIKVQKVADLKRDVKWNNHKEWDNWNLIKKHPDKIKFLAECVSLSECKKFLVQVRGESIKEIPKEIPKWIYQQVDYQNVDNWVLINNHPCLCDYGLREFKIR